MVNKYFELDRLRSALQSRGLEASAINIIMLKAESEIDQASSSVMTAAMDEAVSRGVELESADFINQLKPNYGAFTLETESGNMDFSESPFPMLPRLLQGASPIKDGSGVYKVIPIGGKSTPKPSIASNIFDAHKAISATRAEAARKQYNGMAPTGSVQFRTASSKQDSSKDWVMPAKSKDFTDSMKSINDSVEQQMNDIILDVVRNYEEQFT